MDKQLAKRRQELNKWKPQNVVAIKLKHHNIVH